jgi:hypothetical protein
VSQAFKNSSYLRRTRKLFFLHRYLKTSGRRRKPAKNPQKKLENIMGKVYLEKHIALSETRSTST